VRETGLWGPWCSQQHIENSELSNWIDAVTHSQSQVGKFVIQLLVSPDSRKMGANRAPVSNPTISFWTAETLPFSDLRSTNDLPPEVDIIIVGGGFSGVVCVPQWPICMCCLY
jgi:hypothetical protein